MCSRVPNCIHMGAGIWVPLSPCVRRIQILGHLRLRHVFLLDGSAVRRAVKRGVLDRGRSLESEQEEGNAPVLGAQRQDIWCRCITDARGRHHLTAPCRASTVCKCFASSCGCGPAPGSPVPVSSRPGLLLLLLLLGYWALEPAVA